MFIDHNKPRNKPKPDIHVNSTATVYSRFFKKYRATYLYTQLPLLSIEVQSSNYSLLPRNIVYKISFLKKITKIANHSLISPLVVYYLYNFLYDELGLIELCGFLRDRLVFMVWGTLAVS